MSREAISKAVRPSCALTIDVEDWYQSFADSSAPLSDRVVANTELVLALLEECSVRATFFVLGEVATQFPSLVREIVTAGHEVQSHGDRHVALTGQSRPQLLSRLSGARRALEDVTGQPVTSFRAPYFSVTAQNLSALETIRAAGFTVDSSIFPIAMPRYGIGGWPTGPRRLHLDGRGALLEVPVSVYTAGRLRMPMGGGGYVRLLPRALVAHACRQLIQREQPVILYCHPYEFNADEVNEYRRAIPWHRRWTQSFGRRAAAQRWRAILTSFPFAPLRDVLAIHPAPALELHLNGSAPLLQEHACASH